MTLKLNSASNNVGEKNQMPRGLYFQATFDPNGSPNTGKVSDGAIQSNAGPEKKIVSTLKDKVYKKKVFRTCDFPDTYEKVTFEGCLFDFCDFVGGKWLRAKFSKCIFASCNIAVVTFEDCIFYDCTFEKISVSGQQNIFRNTTIDPTAFLAAIMTNLDFLPPEKSKGLQSFRLRKTVSEVAYALVVSTRDEPNQNFYFDANREYALRQLEWRMEQAFRKDDYSKQSWPTSWFRATRIFLELLLISLSGGLTKWGSSILRPMVFFVVLTTLFAIAYKLVDPDLTGQAAALRSLDVSIVAGYTRHQFNSKQYTYLPTLHVLLAIYWYSLVVPLIVKRTIR